MPHQPQHSLIILAVDNLAKSGSFYDSAFDWKRRVDAPVYIEYAVTDQLRIGLYVREGFARNTGKVPSASPADQETTSTELYFHFDNADEVMQRLTDAGAPLLSPMQQRDWGDQAAYFADPDGNVLVIARMPQA